MNAFSAMAIQWCLFSTHKKIILAGQDSQELDDIVQEMRAVGFNLTIEGDIADFLGIQIDRFNDNTFNLSQPHLINDVIKELRLDGQNVAIKKTTGASSRRFWKVAHLVIKLCTIYGDMSKSSGTSRNLDSLPSEEHFNYCWAIGQLNFLEKCSRLDISCAFLQEQVLCQTQGFHVAWHSHDWASKWLDQETRA
jgi:hypothetical protein